MVVNVHLSVHRYCWFLLYAINSDRICCTWWNSRSSRQKSKTVNISTNSSAMLITTHLALMGYRIYTVFHLKTWQSICNHSSIRKNSFDFKNNFCIAVEDL